MPARDHYKTFFKSFPHQLTRAMKVYIYSASAHYIYMYTSFLLRNITKDKIAIKAATCYFDTCY